ncbi:tRNA-specific adenosine deaminase [compost metagenome]
MKHKMIKPYMETAKAFAQLSYAKRKKVGGIAITPQDIVIYSWNGRAIGDPNNCEDSDGQTLEEVLHCESNLVAKAAREGISLKGSTVVVTLSPCMNCSKQMFQSGVSHVIYDELYRDTKGIEYLKKHGVFVERYEEE